ncbi:MAG: TolB family protein [Nitrospirota bacterium]
MRILFLSIIMLLAFPAPGHAKFDPSFDWTVLETPNFLIHYHQGGEDTAKKAAAIAEDVHARLVPRMLWEPRERTRIVLVDAMDEANGYASPIPYNQIILYLTQPAGSQGFGLTSYDDWLRLVITHEYTHILQLDMVAGIPKAIQTVLGRVYFPNLFQPVWLIEGLATYEETEQTSGGRGRSLGAEMVLRTAVYEGAFPTLDKMSVYPDAWPAGQVPYLFGESFNRFIAEKYGRDRLAEVSTVYSGRGLPFFVESTALRTLGREYETLWSEWEASLRERYRTELETIIRQPLTVSAQRTRKGFVTTGPWFSPVGRRIAFAAVQGDEYPGVYIMNSDGTDARKVAENVFPSSASGTGLSWGPDGRTVVYTKIEVVQNVASYNDIYAADIGTGRETRLTKGLRARDPHLTHDGKWMVFVMNRMGMTRIARLADPLARQEPAGERDIAPLTAWVPEQYESPRISPDGTRIAVSLWKPGGSRDIRILDMQGNAIEEVTNDRAIDCGPAWSADGSLLYFSSDRTGIFNLYAYELAAKKLWQVTNVLGGAFAPSPSPDNTTIAFTSYSAKGYDIHTMANDRALWTPAAPAAERYPTVQYALTSVATTTYSYSPASTVYPRFWLPAFGTSAESGTMIGAFTYGEDVIQRHRYLAEVLYGPSSGRTWYSVDYFYEGFYPSIKLHAADGDMTYSGFLEDGQGKKDYVERYRYAGGGVVIPVLRNAWQQWFIVEYEYKRISALTDLPPWPGYAGLLPAQGSLASGRVSWLWNSTRKYPFSISPEDGRMLEFGYERFDGSLGSDYEYSRYSADWQEYLGLPFKHQVLLARAYAGTSTGQPPPQGAYQLGGDTLGDITMTLDDQFVYLRGYPPNIMRGRHAALASLEYRFPVAEIERGSSGKPFYSRRFHGAVFAEAGSAWDGSLHHDDVRRSIGAEARLDMTLAYYLPITLRLVLARGFDEDGETQLYFAMWVPLEL